MTAASGLKFQTSGAVFRFLVPVFGFVVFQGLWFRELREVDRGFDRLLFGELNEAEPFPKPRNLFQFSVFGFRASVFGFRVSVFGFRFAGFGF